MSKKIPRILVNIPAAAAVESPLGSCVLAMRARGIRKRMRFSRIASPAAYITY
jgi:hypothetical protein